MTVIHEDEPMSRGRSHNPHTAEYLYRTGGTSVYVSGYRGAGNGVSQQEFERLRREDPDGVRAHRWDIRVRDAEVYVKGKITHRDHATLDLGDIWYRVYLNTEDQSMHAKSVAFLD